MAEDVIIKVDPSELVPLEESDLILARLDQARALLAEAKDARDAKRVADLAQAAEIYARRQKLSEDAIAYAHEIRIEAMTLLGEFLQGAELSEGGRPRKTAGSDPVVLFDTPAPVVRTPTLAEIGISHDESKTAQFLSRLRERNPIAHEEIKRGERSITEVRRAEAREAAAKFDPEIPTGKYRIVYADPPWRYGDTRDGLEGTTGASAHYPTLSIAELCALPVIEWIEDNAVLFLWTTSPLLFECAPVIKAWGFQYKASFVWDKIRHNLGHYNSVRHELLLVCTRGSCLPDVRTLYDSVVSIERGEHSAKPEEFRVMIDALYPHGRRLEMFARTKADKWEIYGNELLQGAA